MTEKDISKKELILKRAKRIPAADLLETPINDRRNFNLISTTLEEKTIISEADRCLYCDEICNICTTVCPNFANYSYEIDPVKYPLQKAIQNSMGELEIEEDSLFEVSQKYQILNIDNFCNDCGNCDTFCPTQSAPFKNKPKLHLTLEGFSVANFGYFLEKNENHNILYFKNNGLEVTLKENSNQYVYETENIIAKFDKNDFKIIELHPKNSSQKEFNFQTAASMSVILKGAENLI
jgi:putative selenate reductase